MKVVLRSLHPVAYLAALTALYLIATTVPNAWRCLALAHEVFNSSDIRIYRVSDFPARAQRTVAGYAVRSESRALADPEKALVRRMIAGRLIVRAIMPPVLQRFGGLITGFSACIYSPQVGVTLSGGKRTLEATVGFSARAIIISDVWLGGSPSDQFRELVLGLFPGDAELIKACRSDCGKA